MAKLIHVGPGLPMEPGRKVRPGSFDLASFGRGKIVFRRVLIDLTTPRTDEELRIEGNVIFCPHTTAPVTDAVDVRLNRESDPITFHQGMALSGVPFSTVWISNAAAAGNVLQLVYCTDPNADAVAVREG